MFINEVEKSHIHCVLTKTVLRLEVKIYLKGG